MSDIKRLIVLIGIMLGASALAIATTIGFLYDAGYERERARLINLVETEALLIDALTGCRPTAAPVGREPSGSASAASSPSTRSSAATPPSPPRKCCSAAGRAMRWL